MWDYVPKFCHCCYKIIEKQQKYVHSTIFNMNSSAHDIQMTDFDTETCSASAAKSLGHGEDEDVIK